MFSLIPVYPFCLVCHPCTAPLSHVVIALPCLYPCQHSRPCNPGHTSPFGISAYMIPVHVLHMLPPLTHVRLTHCSCLGSHFGSLNDSPTRLFLCHFFRYLNACFPLLCR